MGMLEVIGVGGGWEEGSEEGKEEGRRISERAGDRSWGRVEKVREGRSEAGVRLGSEG